MEIGVYHEFHCRPDQTAAAAFEEALRQIEAADRWGLDAIWLAEIHQQARRSVLSAPLTVAAAIAARTRRVKIGTGVQVLPLCHPLRLAEETATIDQISKGRLLFGVGRSGNPRSYVAYGVPYSESRERFLETLEIVKRAWTQPSFSYEGKYYSFNNASAVPRPYQQPYPPIRVAAASEETFPSLGEAGYPIFVAVRSGSLSGLAPDLAAYRRAYREAGHPGEGEVYLRLTLHIADTDVLRTKAGSNLLGVNTGVVQGTPGGGVGGFGGATTATGGGAAPPLTGLPGAGLAWGAPWTSPRETSSPASGRASPYRRAPSTAGARAGCPCRTAAYPCRPRNNARRTHRPSSRRTSRSSGCARTIA